MTKRVGKEVAVYKKCREKLSKWNIDKQATNKQSEESCKLNLSGIEELKNKASWEHSVNKDIRHPVGYKSGSISQFLSQV